MKTIMIVTPALSGGGAERVAVNLANEWAGKGKAVHLLSIRDINDYSGVISPEVNLITLGSGRVRFSVLSLRRQIKRINPDVVLSVMRSTNILTAAALPLGAKLRLGMREANPLHAIRELPWFRRHGMLALMRYSYKRAAAVIANSPDTLADLHQAGIALRNGRVIFNPVVTSSLSQESPGPAPHSWLADPDKEVIVSAGRLHYQKDYFTLLRAFSLLLLTRPGARLIIMGKGEEEDALKCFAEGLGISSKVDFVGFVDNPFSYMRHADLFALSSRWEGFGNVLVESFACGVPVVATDCSGGPKNITRGGALGRLVPVGDYEAFADAMVEVLDDPPAASTLRSRADEFSVEIIATEYWRALMDG